MLNGGGVDGGESSVVRVRIGRESGRDDDGGGEVVLVVIVMVLVVRVEIIVVKGVLW